MYPFLVKFIILFFQSQVRYNGYPKIPSQDISYINMNSIYKLVVDKTLNEIS